MRYKQFIATILLACNQVVFSSLTYTECILIWGCVERFHFIGWINKCIDPYHWSLLRFCMVKDKAVRLTVTEVMCPVWPVLRSQISLYSITNLSIISIILWTYNSLRNLAFISLTKKTYLSLSNICFLFFLFFKYWYMYFLIQGLLFFIYKSKLYLFIHNNPHFPH